MTSAPMVHPLPTVQLESLHFGPKIVDEPTAVYKHEKAHKHMVDKVPHKVVPQTSTR
jgi:hypothetical protein